MLISCQKSEIKETKAVEIAKSYIESYETEEFIKTITNFDSPITEKMELEDTYNVISIDKNNGEIQSNDLKGKKIWRITFTTKFDFVLGSYIIYLDIYSGEIYGLDGRM